MVHHPYLYHRATGSASIASTLAPAKNIMLYALKLHLSATGGTVENFTATVDSVTAAAYDILLFSQDMNTTTDILWVPEHPIPIFNGDEIDFAYANSNTRTYGLEVIYRLEA